MFIALFAVRIESNTKNCKNKTSTKNRGDSKKGPKWNSAILFVWCCRTDRFEISREMKGLKPANSVCYLRKDVYDDLNEYKEDFKRIIRQREEERIIFLHQSPQFDRRGCLVYFIKTICVEKALSQNCLQLAVYLLDVFMDNHRIAKHRLILVANVCLLLAAKLEENSTRIPKIVELNAHANDVYTIDDYKNLEILILQFFHFYIKFPTPAHYVFYYMQVFISYDDLKGGRNLRTLYYDITAAITIHLGRVIDDVHYMQHYKPSELAAAVIAAGRKDAGLACWTKQLENMTEYTEEQLQEPMQSLLNKRELYCSNCPSAEAPINLVMSG